MATSSEEQLQVLVVDDDSDTATICEGLSTDRHQFEVSNRAASGLALLHEGANYDMVVVDFVLDEGTAIDFIRKARKIRPDIPYLMWSVSSSEDVAREFPRYGLNAVFEAGIVAFAEKQDVQVSSESMGAFLDEAAEFFRKQIEERIRPELLGAFRQLEVALSHTRGAIRSIDEPTSPPTDRPRPIQYRLYKVESIVRRLLGYPREVRRPTKALAREALDEILVQNHDEQISQEVQSCLQTLAKGANGRREAKAVRSLRSALDQASDNSGLQRAMATRTAEIVEFMIYAGEPRRAAYLSAELWSHANESWSPAPRISCGITHAYALASAGSVALAEHLVSAILMEAETTFPERSYNELARSVFAELDQFSHAALGN